MDELTMFGRPAFTAHILGVPKVLFEVPGPPMLLDIGTPEGSCAAARPSTVARSGSRSVTILRRDRDYVQVDCECR
jgi:hypothetical protein